MQTKLKLFASLFLLVGMGFYARAQSTAFTYQGRLNNGTNLAIGSFDLRFALFDSLTSGTQQGTTLTNVATAISNGLFTVTLNFGSQFPGPGPNRWLGDRRAHQWQRHVHPAGTTPADYSHALRHFCKLFTANGR